MDFCNKSEKVSRLMESHFAFLPFLFPALSTSVTLTLIKALIVGA